MALSKKFSTRIFGGETASTHTFTVKNLACFNDMTERFFLDQILIDIPRPHPRIPLNDEQRKIYDSYLVIKDKDGTIRSKIETWVSPLAYDFGKLNLNFIDNPLHLFPDATITVDVPAKADFFFGIFYFIVPL